MQMAASELSPRARNCWRALGILRPAPERLVNRIGRAYEPVRLGPVGTWALRARRQRQRYGVALLGSAFSIRPSLFSAVP